MCSCVYNKYQIDLSKHLEMHFSQNNTLVLETRREQKVAGLSCAALASSRQDLLAPKAKIRRWTRLEKSRACTFSHRVVGPALVADMTTAVHRELPKLSGMKGGIRTR